MVLLTPVSKIKDNFLPLTSIGITTRLLIKLNRTDCSFWLDPKKLKVDCDLKEEEKATKTKKNKKDFFNNKTI